MHTSRISHRARSKAVLSVCLVLELAAAPGSGAPSQSGADPAEPTRHGGSAQAEATRKESGQSEPARRSQAEQRTVPPRTIPVRMITTNARASQPGAPVARSGSVRGVLPTASTVPARRPRRHISVRMVTPEEVHAPVRVADAPVIDPGSVPWPAPGESFVPALSNADNAEAVRATPPGRRIDLADGALESIGVGIPIIATPEPVFGATRPRPTRAPGVTPNMAVTRVI